MKILHTSDWHLGCTLYDHQRFEEQQSLLERITVIARAEAPDAIIIAGDIFDTATPSSRVQRMFVDSIDRLRAECPDTAIVIIAGNHDSGTRHEIFATPWRRHNIYLVGDLPAGDDARDKLIITVPGKGYIVAVPYLNAREMRDNPYPALLDRVAALNTGNLPVIITGHLAVTGCDSSGHTSDSLTIGNIDCCGSEIFGTGADYVALGHIHRPQTLSGTDGRVRYSGSPMQVSFDEKWPHSLSIVEIASHGATPEVSEIFLEPEIPLITVPDMPVRWGEALQALRDFDASTPAYLRLNVGQSEPLPPDAIHAASLICADKDADVCFINYTRIVDGVPDDSAMHMSVRQLEQSSPAEIARMYIESRGITFDDDLDDMMRQVMKQLEDDERAS